MNNTVHILVVDDDRDLGGMIKLMLEYKAYKVTVSEKAEQAEQIILNNKIDLIIMDMLLSGVNGMDICKRIRQNSVVSHIPIIMFSAYPDGKETCMAAGADEFISKPFDMEDLLSKVASFVNHLQPRYSAT